jgi:hypothetical protein
MKCGTKSIRNRGAKQEIQQIVDSIGPDWNGEASARFMLCAIANSRPQSDTEHYQFTAQAF